MKKAHCLTYLLTYCCLVMPPYLKALFQRENFFTCLFEIYHKKTSMEYYFFLCNYLAQELIYWYEIWCTNSCSLQDNFRNCSKVKATLNHDEHD